MSDNDPKLSRAHFFPLRDPTIPRTHANCEEETGRKRPGKTACDRYHGRTAPKGYKARARLAAYEDSINYKRVKKEKKQ